MNSTNRLYAFLATLCGCVVALFFAEMVVRVARPLMSPQFVVEDSGETLQSDPALGHTIVPGTTGHDERGFKNSHALTRSRVVALGDSHTYGIYGDIDGSWPAVLSKRVGATVYNMGVWGYGPLEYLGLLPNALALKPEVVVVALYMGNDIFNAYDAAYHRDAWSQYRDPSFTDKEPIDNSTFKETRIPLKTVRDFLRSHLELYALVGDGTRLVRERVGLASPRTVGTLDWSTTDPDASLRYEGDLGVDTMFWVGSRIKGVDTTRVEIVEGLRVAELALVDMQRETQQNGATLVVVLIPSKESVYAPLVEDAGMHNDTFKAIVSHEASIRARILALCDTKGMHCLDMLPALSAAIQNSQTIYRNHWDEHPMRGGYAVYADIIAEAVTPNL